ncbi:hypothetical protein Poli38472_010098 [Pythium oligandrum]|uniref:Uncharacterized protein n=1 Tax=Pythium oligandrum TaxID=41045 RepID=A0A8K1C8B6_PYTOL|nr:hypothetical protein Poli38472_010098 [Pythium oligandrum]|eukprot:TMW58539.1 hypothetical protein Poli38472_010098 [Pythium oligandrum]
MIPPSYVKGVSIKNTTSVNVKVTAVFGSDEQEKDGKAKVHETRELAPGDHVEIEEHEFDMGSYTAVAALTSLHVEPVGGALGASPQLQKTTFTPQVTEIVPVLNVEIKTHPTEQSLHVAAV